MKNFILLILLTTAASLSKAQNIPTYTIAQVRGNNSFEGGAADSNNVRCKIYGVVYGRNFGATGNRIQFTLRDATGGIGIFRNTNDLNITLNEGDSIRAIGLVNHFNGLTQLTLDSVKKLAVNRPLKTPVLVFGLGEDTESDLVKLEGWQLSTPASWPAVPPASGFTVKVKKGSSEVDLRIDNDCDLYGAPAPTGLLNIIGIGGQFDSSIPRNSGYQLLPRSAADITPGLPPVKPLIRFLQTDTLISENTGILLLPVQVTPAPESQTVLFIVAQDSNAINGTDYALQQSLLTFPANFPGNQFINVPIFDNNVNQGFRVFRIKLRKIDNDTTFSIGSDSVIRITITDNDPPVNQYPISLIRGNNSVEGGCADSLGVRCKVKGQLCGRNFFASEGEFGWAMRDGTGSIALYLDENPFGNLKEGDSVRVTGVVSQLNGLSFLNVESLEKTADSIQAPLPQTVDSLSEASESALISLSGYQILNPAEWTGNPQGFYVTVGNGSRQYELWLDNELIPFPASAPAGLLSITGIGDQDDDTPPYQSNYRIRLVRPSGIQVLNSISELQNGNFRFYPNPFREQVNISTEGYAPDSQVWLRIVDLSGKQLYGNQLPLNRVSSMLNAVLNDTGISACFVKIHGSEKLSFGSLLMRKP